MYSCSAKTASMELVCGRKPYWFLFRYPVEVDRNVIKKEADKILKYKDLTIEIQHMWNVQYKQR
jgi:hypothetical protein